MNIRNIHETKAFSLIIEPSSRRIESILTVGQSY